MNWVLTSITTPFRDSALIVNLSFAVVLGALFWVVSVAGVFGLFALPALIVLLPLFVKYCLLVGRQAAHGHIEHPDLSLSSINPFEIQPIALAAGLFVLHLVLLAALGPIAAVIGTALVAPLAIAVFVIEERAEAAFDPRVLYQYVAGLGLAYPVLAAVLALAIYLCGLVVDAGLGAFAAVFLIQSILIAAFHAMGQLLYARADAIRYERPETADERKARILGESERRDFEKKVAHWYRLAEADKPERALEGIMAHMASRDHDLNLYAEVFDRLASWHESVLAPAFAREYVHRLFRADQHGRALDVFLRAWDINTTVRPAGELDTLRIAEQARRIARNDVALALVSDFEERFPQSRNLGLALAQEAWLLFTERHDLLNAADLLYRIEHEFPKVFARPDVRRLATRVRGRLGQQEEDDP